MSVLSTIRTGAMIARKGVAKHLPEILTAASTGGVVVCVVLSVDGTVKAVRLYDKKSGELGRPLTKAEMVEYLWKCYIPVFVAASGTIAAMIGATSINLKRNATLLSMYAIEKKAFDEYKGKTKELFGEKKEQKIFDEIAKDKVAETANVPYKIIGEEDFRVLDVYSGYKYRGGSKEKILRAENRINARMLQGGEMYCSYAELRDELGWDYISYGDDVGFNVNNLVQFKFSSQLDKDGTPMLVVDFISRPTADYKDIYKTDYGAMY